MEELEVSANNVDSVPNSAQAWAALSEEILASNLPPLNEKLANYNLKKALGQGGYGTVYLAQKAMDGSPVAIKVVKKSRLAEKRLGGASEMINEMNILRDLSNNTEFPSIFTKLHDAFQDGHNFYLVQNYVPGGSLADEMEKGGCVFSLRRVEFYMAQLSLGTAFLHSLGIIHRDLKPITCYSLVLVSWSSPTSGSLLTSKMASSRRTIVVRLDTPRQRFTFSCRTRSPLMRGLWAALCTKC